MKLNKAILYLSLALPALVLQSCLKDDDDKFSETSSERASAYIEQAKQTLQNSENGWILDYYPEANQSYGGYTYAMTFKGNEATVHFENTPDDVSTSLYSLKSDNGPVLTFDTYNPAIHFFSTPTTSLYQAYQGDFEFVVDSIGEDVVKVHGKRSQNTMYFRKLTEPAADYINKVVAMGDGFGLYGAVGTVGGQQAQIMFDRDNRQAVVMVDSTQVQTAYNYTDKGIRFYKPVTLAGVTFQELVYNDADLSLKGDGAEFGVGIYDPSIIANAIGSVGSDDEAFTREFKDIQHLDQVRFVTDADWLTVTANGTTVTINATENNTGDVRSTNVYVVSAVTNQVYSSFTVSQMNEKDILGTYAMLFYDSNNQRHVVQANIASQRNGLALTMTAPILGTDFDLSFKAEFNQTHGALAIQSGQVINSQELSLRSSDGSTVNGYLMNAFLFNSQYWSSYRDNFFGLMPFQHDDTNGTYAQLGQLLLGGQESGYDVDAIVIAFTTALQPSASSMAGEIDQWTNCTLVKMGANGAKGNVIKLTSGRKNVTPNFVLRSLPKEGFKLMK